MAELKLYIYQEYRTQDDAGANFDENHVFIGESYELARAYFYNLYGGRQIYSSIPADVDLDKWFDEHSIIHEISLAKIPGYIAS